MDCQLLNLWRGASSPDFSMCRIWDDFLTVNLRSSAPHLQPTWSMFREPVIGWVECFQVRGATSCAPQYMGEWPLVEVSLRCPTDNNGNPNRWTLQTTNIVNICFWTSASRRRGDLLVSCGLPRGKTRPQLRISEEGWRKNGYGS